VVALTTKFRRFDVYLVDLNPTRGAEIQKTRPCLIVSSDDMNRHLATVIVAPLTTRVRGYPSRTTVRFQGKRGEIALDQIRAVDKTRLVRRLGRIAAPAASRAISILQKIFSP
jgi:mRNA interferase MazF